MRHLVQSSSSLQLTRLVTALSLGCFLVLAGPAGAQAKGSGVGQAAVVRALPSTLPELSPAEFAARREALLVKSFVREAEPNDTFGTATPLGTTPVRVRADSYAVPVPGAGDVDFYSFTAGAGDRVYAATMTSFSPGSTDTLLAVLASDGTTVLESDDEDGGLSGSASNIAGLVLPTAGTYFIRVSPFTLTLAGTIRPYDLYVRVLSGAPTAETEPNNNGAPGPQATAGNGWMNGAITPLADNDTFSVPANAGDTIAVILDVDPERDTPEWNARVGIGVFNNFFLIINSSAVGGTFDDANPSEAIFMTVDTTGSYQVFIDESAATPAPTGNPTNTYAFSVSVIPADSDRTTSNTCTGTTGPITDAGTTDFTCNITTPAIIDNLQLRLNETHTGATPLTADLDISLISPDGNEVVLVDDPASAAAAPAPQLNLLLDDEAATPMANFGVNAGMRYQPESFARLNYFKGMQAQGTWTLRVRDDLASQTGTLNSWSLIVGEAPANTNCTAPVPVISAGFETDDGGFTHSGVQDEWARGLPTFAPITTCHGGSNCFKTDLANTYNASGNFDLLSPNINLTAVAAPIALSWWQKYQFDTASNDSFWVEVRIVGNPASAVKVWEWKGAVQTRTVGPAPATVVNVSAGWGQVQADISSFAGQNVEVRFHGESSATVQLAGWAIDDFLVQSACLVPVELIDFDVE